MIKPASEVHSGKVTQTGLFSDRAIMTGSHLQVRAKESSLTSRTKTSGLSSNKQRTLLYKHKRSSNISEASSQKKVGQQLSDFAKLNQALQASDSNAAYLAKVKKREDNRVGVNKAKPKFSNEFAEKIKIISLKNQLKPNTAK